ncbi:MAG: hypothetical protein I8H77_04435 [Comamonadaceae bacterium]|nr:hypothetical protein [Comamonadaceae bacterium]
MTMAHMALGGLWGGLPMHGMMRVVRASNPPAQQKRAKPDASIKQLAPRQLFLIFGGEDAMAIFRTLLHRASP